MGNVSGLDRFVRIVLGLLIVFYTQNNMIQGLWTTVLLIVGIVIVLTGIFGWCGIYSIFGCSTKKTSSHKISKKDIQKAVEEHMAIKSETKAKKAPAKKAAPKKAAASKKTTTKKTAPKKAATTKKTSTKSAVKKTKTAKKTTSTKKK